MAQTGSTKERIERADRLRCGPLHPASILCAALLWLMCRVAFAAPAAPADPTAMALSADSIRVVVTRTPCSPAITTFARSLESVDGIRADAPNDGLSRAIVRGMRGSKVAIVDAGLPVSSIPLDAFDGIAIDPERAAWIGWLHGPASLRYGGDALTGVLRIEPRETPPTAGRFDLGGMAISGTP